MAQVYPFRAHRYNPALVMPERVLTQPYDKISPEMQEKYYAADPHNLIGIEKGRTFPADTPQENVYTRAAAALERWIAEGTIVRDSVPAFYAYFQDYAVPGSNERRVRKGFIGLGRLEDYEAGVVFRHEQTLSAPKADRLELLRHTRAQTGQLFMLYSDPECRVDALLNQAAAAAHPAVDVRDEFGVLHRLWPIADPAQVAEIQRLMGPQKLVIADGHHRYETALNYRNERRAAGAAGPDAASERTMMTFINAHSEGLTILPTHRVVSNLIDFSLHHLFGQLLPHFDIGVHPFNDQRERSQAYDAFQSHFTEEWRDRSRRCVGIYAGADRSWCGEQAFFVLCLKHGADLAKLLPAISPPQRELDVVLLHQFLLGRCLGITEQAVTAETHITYEREVDAAIAAVDRGAAQVAFVLNPVAVEQVMRIATAGEVLPQKSTDFYPKLLSGITIYRLEE
ncbi:MAG: DUF1015 domain-containing protein [Candidatus Acidiferrales bacterium]|jgi:uncharacterized protein (DUF1015 family)